MFTVESLQHDYTVSVVCDTLAEAQNLSEIRGFFQGNTQFEDAESIAIYIRDASQGVKFIQTVFIHPQTPEQEEATREAAEFVKLGWQLMRKKHLVSDRYKLELYSLVADLKSALEDAD